MQFELRNLSYSYPGSSTAQLQDISLCFASTCITGLAGANGSGKTTLIRILLRELVDSRGDYLIDEHPVPDRTGSTPARYRIGYSPDIAILDDSLTGRDILELVAELRGAGQDSFLRDLEFMRRQLRIDNWLETQPCGEYSAGMRKKLSIAVAFTEPVAFAILDEPLNGLDPIAVFGMRNLVAEKRSRGIGSLISSHILDFVQKIADNVILLTHGRCAYRGPYADLAAQYGGAGLEEIYFQMFSDSRR